MFDSRQQAAELLVQQLKKKGYSDKNTIVLAIPRGGVVTGKIVADRLGCPLDIVITRKIPAPYQPELALGAVGPEGMRVIDVALAKRAGADETYLKGQIGELKKEVGEREKKFRGEKERPEIRGKTAVIVDDGIATGSTVEAAIRYVIREEPKKIILASPISSQESMKRLKSLVDDVVVLETPKEFMAVGQFYKDFPQVTDEEVIEILRG